jgi:hypothetical protein
MAAARPPLEASDLRPRAVPANLRARALLAACLACVLAGAWLAIPARAANPDDVPQYQRRGGGASGGETAAKAQPDFPAFPRSEELVRLDGDEIEARYAYWIDQRNLAIDGDGVIRYTIVLQSPQGAANVFFEGFRCDARAYKTYAYATRQGRFQPYAKGRWRELKEVRESASRAYLWLLYHRYFCSFDGQRLGLEDIRRKLAGQATATNEGWRKAWDK